MAKSILRADVGHRGIPLDPRTKLFALLTIAMFALGGMGGPAVDRYIPLICLIPFALLLSAGRIRQALLGALIFFASFLLLRHVVPATDGALHFILLGTSGILSRFFPGIMMGAYLMGTTTVSEFNAAMHRIHVPEVISIPLSVMFRFFPTVFDEAASISDAMRMRDIRFGGKNAGKILEYRLVPLLACTAKVGEELSAAALTRGLGGNVKRTNICKIGFRVQDAIVFILCLIPWGMMVAGWFGIL